MDLGAEVMGFVTAFVVKIAVMALAATLIFRLYHVTHAKTPKRLWLLLPKEDLPDVKLIWWSLVLFGISETTCGIEIYILFQSSAPLTVIHAVTSALGMGLFGLGAAMYLDRTVFRFGERRCAAQGACRGCTLVEGKGCRYRSFLALLATLVGVSAIPPFFAPTAKMPAEPEKYVLPFATFNAWFDETLVPLLKAGYPDYVPSGRIVYLPTAQLITEYRVLPAIALCLAIVAVGLFLSRRERLGLKVTAFALGVLAYTYFELALYRVTGDMILGSLGHEVVEFLFLIATAEFLGRTFGQRGAQ